jgi:hypothetical protein
MNRGIMGMAFGLLGFLLGKAQDTSTVEEEKVADSPGYVSALMTLREVRAREDRSKRARVILASGTVFLLLGGLLMITPEVREVGIALSLSASIMLLGTFAARI